VNSRGFAILLLIAVAASVACGLIVERYTAPGIERTFWFAVGLAAIIFPAGKFAERRGWVKGVWRAGSPDTGTGAPAAAAGQSPTGGDAPPAARPSSGESK